MSKIHPDVLALARKAMHADKDKYANWIAGATENKGGLHRALGVPEGEKIPKGEIKAAAKEPGKVGKEARLAETLEGLHHSKNAMPSETADVTPDKAKEILRDGEVHGHPLSEAQKGMFVAIAGKDRNQKFSRKLLRAAKVAMQRVNV